MKEKKRERKEMEGEKILLLYYGRYSSSHVFIYFQCPETSYILKFT